MSWEQMEAERHFGVPSFFKNELGMTFVLIPPGEFVMGSPRGEEGRDDDEPQHTVRITRPFYMQAYECRRHFGSDDHRPMDQVSHVDIAGERGDGSEGFLAWLNGRKLAGGPPGLTYRLPTEAEWEYACRAGRSTPYSFGEALPDGYANVRTAGKRPSIAQHAVADIWHFPSNPWGLLQMHGNVAEWCSDWYAADFYEQSPRDDPGGPTVGTRRVVRGGSAFLDASRARSANRDDRAPDVSAPGLGFRLVAAMSEPIRRSEAPPQAPPAWARVTSAQRAAAREHGVAVAFENDIGMRFVLIPAGSFLMGSPDDEASRHEGERQHEVVLSRPYYLAATEVTNAQYRRFRPDHDSGENGQYPDGDRSTLQDPDLNGDDKPVVKVSWFDAQAFLAWLRLREGKSYRLPTEAEWERACRAGSTTQYGMGDHESDLARAAWYRANFTGGSHAVSQKEPNAFGVYDMHGNVSEWCEDWVGDYGDGPRVDPRGPPTGRARSLRGGWFLESAAGERCAVRRGSGPATGAFMIGFRPVIPVAAD